LIGKCGTRQYFKNLKNEDCLSMAITDRIKLLAKAEHCLSMLVNYEAEMKKVKELKEQLMKQ
jgi:hypothetical protein